MFFDNNLLKFDVSGLLSGRFRFDIFVFSCCFCQTGFRYEYEYIDVFDNFTIDMEYIENYCKKKQNSCKKEVTNHISVCYNDFGNKKYKQQVRLFF